MLKDHRVVGGHQLELLGSEAFSLPEIFKRSCQVHMWCTRFNRFLTSTFNNIIMEIYFSPDLAALKTSMGDWIASLGTS